MSFLVVVSSIFVWLKCFSHMLAIVSRMLIQFSRMLALVSGMLMIFICIFVFDCMVEKRQETTFCKYTSFDLRWLKPP